MPGLVTGPNLCDCAFASGNVIKSFWNGNTGNRFVPLVDVRDTAEAHLQAILKPEVAGKRFMLVNETVFWG